MSDAAVLTIVSGTITIVGLVTGFLTLWVKLKYNRVQTEAAVRKATAAVGDKLDDNTALTRTVNGKADTIVQQTDGALDRMRVMVEGIAERVEKLEEYNHTSAHRLLNVVNVLTLKVERLLVMNEVKMPPMSPSHVSPPTPGEGGPQ